MIQQAVCWAASHVAIQQCYKKLFSDGLANMNPPELEATVLDMSSPYVCVVTGL